MNIKMFINMFNNKHYYSKSVLVFSYKLKSADASILAYIS